MNPRAAFAFTLCMFSTAMLAWQVAGPYWVIMFVVTIVYGLWLSLVVVS